MGPDDEKLWEAVAGLFFGPNVFVPLVLTGILKQRRKRRKVRDGAAWMDPALLLGCSGKALGLFPGLWSKFCPGTAR